jgi:hypothetical protein
MNAWGSIGNYAEEASLIGSKRCLSFRGLNPKAARPLSVKIKTTLVRMTRNDRCEKRS